MASDDGRTTAQANRLGEILGAYFVAVEEGCAPSRQELLEQHPDLAAELAEYFAEQDRLDRMVAPLRPAGGADSIPSPAPVLDLLAEILPGRGDLQPARHGPVSERHRRPVPRDGGRGTALLNGAKPIRHAARA
jgi:hypothetical protein